MIYGKFIDSSTVTGTQIRLDNNQYLRGRNFANTGDLNILRITTSDLIEFKQIPYVEGQGRLALYSELEGIQTSIDYLYGQVSQINEEIETIQEEIAELQENEGDFALKDLSNLTPTAIPNGVNIESVSTSSFAFKTVAKATGNTGAVNIFSGNNTGTGTTGIVDVASGDILNVSSSSNTGIAGLRSGETNGSGNTGNVNIYSGNNTGTGVSGNITISAGTTAANDATTGSIEIQSGYPFGVSDSGNVSIHSHNSSKNSGSVSIYSGDASNSSGNILISTGTASSGATKGGISLNAQSTTVFLTNFSASGANSIFNVQNLAGASSFQVLHYAEESNNSVGIRIFEGSPTSGFSINGWGQLNQNGGPFNFRSTKAYTSTGGSFSGGDFNIIAASTDYIDPSVNSEISSGNVNISTENAYVSGTGANANTGSINLTTGTSQGTGARGNIVLNAPVVNANVNQSFTITTPSTGASIQMGLTSYSQLGGPYMYIIGLASDRTFEIGGQGGMNNTPGLTEVHGASVVSDTDGNYTSGKLILWSKPNTGGNYSDHVSYNSGDVEVFTGDAYVKGTLFPDANTGNVNIYTGTPAGAGTRGHVSINGDYITVNSNQIKNLADATDAQDAVTFSQLTTVSGSFALKDLSNLTPTAIPSGVNLESLSISQLLATSFSVRTKNQTTSVSGRVNIASGTTTGSFASGPISIESGTNTLATGAGASSQMTGTILVTSANILDGSQGTTGSTSFRSGAISVLSSAITSSYLGNTGNTVFGSGSIQVSRNGTTVSGNSGFTNIVSGGVIATVLGSTAIGNSGIVSITSGVIQAFVAGAVVSGNSGNVNLSSGSVTGVGTSTSNTGSSTISTGTVTNSNNVGSTGLTSVSTGQNAGIGNSGSVSISTGNVTNPLTTSINFSGAISAITGKSIRATSGPIILQTGEISPFGFNNESNVNSFTGVFSVTTGAINSALNTGSTGDVLLYSGSHNGIGNTGAVNISSGSQTGTGNSGSLNISSGSAGGNSGDINISTGVASGNKGNINVTAPFLSLKDSTRIEMLKDSSDILARFQIDNGFGNYGQFFFNRFPSSSNIYIGAMESAIDDNGADVVFSGAWSMSNNDGVYTSSRVFLQTNANSGFNDAPNVAVNSGDLSITTGNSFVQGSYTDANSGNILIYTGLAQGSGTRGYIYIDAAYVSMNSKQIKDLADGTDPQDAVTVSQLGSISGSYALTDLSNLVSPTAIPDGVGLTSLTVPTIPNPLAAFEIKTSDQVGADGSGGVKLFSGSIFNPASAQNTGIASLSTGLTLGSGNTGDVNIITGDNVGTGNSGNVNISTGASVAGTKGNINLTSEQVNIYIPNTGIFGIENTSGNALIEFDFSDYGLPNDSVGMRIWNSSTINGFHIIGLGQNNQNGGPFNFDSTFVVANSDGVYTGGNFNIKAVSSEIAFSSASNISVSSGNVNITSADGYVAGSYLDANSGNITLQTGTPQGSGNSGSINITTGTPISGFRGSVNVNAYDMNVTPSASGSFNVMSSSGVSAVSINNQGFSLPNSPAILFNNIPQASVAIFQLYSDLNNNGATFYFSGTMVYAVDDGSYTGGTVNMTSGGAGDITPANAAISSADFNISSANAFVSGSFTDANSGNINISTGNKEGAGTRGYISLSASYINANLAQIKNVADPSDPQDALTLNYFDNNIPSVAANNFYDLQLYNTYAPSYANGSQGVLDPVTPTNPRAGWYFKNTAGSPQKINWYFFDGTIVTGIQLQNFSAFAVMTFDSVAEIPIMNAYTFPTGSGDIIPGFAHSRVVYSAPAVPSPVVGTKYLVYFGEEPEIFPYLPRIELTYNAVQSGGDQGPTELVSTAAFASDSAASANNVQWMVENLGINTPSFKAFFKLLIFPVFEESQDFYGSFYSTQTQDNLVPDIARAMTFNNTDEANGVSIVSNSQITFDSGGLYNIQFSAQFTHSNSSSQPIDIWLSKNGTNVAFTNSKETLAGQVSIISAWNFFVRVNAGDYVEIYWSSPSDDVIIEYSGTQTGPTRPETPSIILTVNKIIS